MSLTALQAILAAMAALSEPPNLLVISETSIDGACAVLANKETFTNGRWIKYRCDEGKGTQIVYEITDSDQAEDESIEVDDVSEDKPREIDWEEKMRRKRMAEERYAREAALREAQMQELRNQEM